MGRWERWPELPYASWKAGRETLHRWLQIAGKVRLAKSPWINHSWQTPLYLTARGLSTSVIHAHSRSFSIEFDFIDHRLEILSADGNKAGFELREESVALFHDRCFEALERLGLHIEISESPNELFDRTPFPLDQAHHVYDPEFTWRFWQAMLQTDRVMQVFRSRFLGKVSPVHFFWGSLDLALTRFSGRRAPKHPGGVPNLPDIIAREAYSHEVSSCGFWPGSEQLPYPAFYSYAYPEPPGFKSAKVLPSSAFYHEKLREFILPYEAIRRARFPETMLLKFFQSTYAVAANLGNWDRKGLEESEELRTLQALHPIELDEAG